MDHPYALRAPWYVRERGQYSLLDPRARRPAIQKYETDDFVERLFTDPRDSTRFDDLGDDVWSYPVPVAATPGPGTGRARFATHTLVRSQLRKLYQPTHDRFYVIVVELFCDVPGLPRAGDAEGIEVGMVLRRRRTTVDAPVLQVRRLARQMAGDLLKAQQPGTQPGGLRGGDLPDVLWADLAARRGFETAHADELAGITVDSTTEAWMVGAAGGHWRTAGTPAPAGETDHELEIPMWRLPPREQDCPPARTRSLWFGLVPTYSADMDREGTPRLDDHAIYEINCFARRNPEPGHEHCPPKISWSEPTEPFRLAAVFDPDGTKNHKVAVKLPDLRTLAARAGRPPGPGGVAVTSPPGSQMHFNPFDGVPKPAVKPVGEAERICVFAFELFIIVGFFVFLLFLPIVVFLFQLWWMLALRFCLPPLVEAFELLETHFTTGGTLGNLPADDSSDPPVADQHDLDAVLGSVGVTKALDDARADVDGVPTPVFDPAMMQDLLAAVDPSGAADPEPGEPETKPDDPLCPAPPGTRGRARP
ncbi:hypothetical protein [Actinoplanes solisilvae]|uniref:hypothetical protein n=1 Tax=Actinoplanes solisilvae TaxID=2486853 RepID=UPI000FD85BE2|nr:hypothetical protein [Actinoplanes solisilvae]